MNPAGTDVRSGRDQNDEDSPLGLGIPEFRLQPDESGDAISVRIGATGVRVTALCDQNAARLVVLQANRARDAGGSVSTDPEDETERRAGPLRWPGIDEIPSGGTARTGPIVRVSGAVVLSVHGGRHTYDGTGQERKRGAPSQLLAEKGEWVHVGLHSAK